MPILCWNPVSYPMGSMSQVSDYTSYKNSLQRMQDSYDAERTETRANHEKELEQTKADAEQDVSSMKAEYNKRIENERAQAREEVKRLKEDLYDHSGKHMAQESRDRQLEKNNLSRYQDEVKRQADRRVAQVEDQSGERAMRQQETEDAKIAEALAAQKRSNYQEVNDLQDQVSEYADAGRDIASEKAKARAQSIAENEHKYLEDKQRIINGYERELAALKVHEDEMGEHYNRQLSEATFDSNHQAQNQIQNQKNEFARIYRDGLVEKKRLEDSYKVQLQDLKDRHAESDQKIIDQNNEAQQRVLANKDSTYKNYIAENANRTDFEIKERDDKIQQLQTTDDPLKVSPYLVKKMNDQSALQNDEHLRAAQSAYAKNLDAERARDLNERREISNHYQERLVGTDRNARTEMDLQNRRLKDTFVDVQMDRDVQIRSLQDQKQEQVERMYKKHAVELSDAERAKQDALLDQRDALLGEKNSEVDTLEHTHHNQDREWFLKTNDLRRSFESKLADERDEHEKITKEIRSEYDKKLRDQDRNSKRALDDRVHSYEHLLEQQELAFKEKERFLTEHYEEELDRMKRTNAHLIQTKS